MEDGIMQESQLLRPKPFLSHPIPECSCTTVKTSENLHPGMNSNLHVPFGGQDECPNWMVQATKTGGTQESTDEETETQEDEIDSGQEESDGSGEADTIPSVELDEEMDPDD
ncbi:unnamed protein product [Fraxinus pennsylvanica]|uniref:Uncharacterized protein n=1 Tax=Fraxinus pennsylvanica TaxID=56036 RepID=A0AAD2AF84_9LAMI|nr:unnamed protein product [Fraxinus pennsylvanica]